jgi:hypothetical protein
VPDQLYNDLGEPFSAAHIKFMCEAETLKAANAALDLAARRRYALHLATGGARVFRSDGQELFSL